MLSPLLADAPGDPRQPFACTHCGACAEACPVGIDHPTLLGVLRRRIAAGTPDPATALFAGLARSPALFSGAAEAARLVDPTGTRLARLSPEGRLARYLRGRRFPGLSRSFSRMVLAADRSETATVENFEKRYAYYGNQTCAADGLCATVCPVAVDTGVFTKDLRRRQSTPRGNAIGGWVGRHYGLVVNVSAAGLGLSHLVHRLLGTRAMPATEPW